MSTHRKFTIEAFQNCEITLEIDLRLMTPATAAEVNSYFDDADQVARLAEGDAVRAIALRAAEFLLHELMWAPRCRTEDEEQQAARAALQNLSAAKGWPTNHGISVVRYDTPEYDSHFFQIVEESTR